MKQQLFKVFRETSAEDLNYNVNTFLQEGEITVVHMNTVVIETQSRPNLRMTKTYVVTLIYTLPE